MSVERGIYDWLKEHKPLTDVLPAARMFTDTAKFDDSEVKFPYLTIEGPEGTSEQRTSEPTQLVDARYTFNVWAETDGLDVAKKAARRLDERLFKSAFAWEFGNVMDAKRVSQSSTLDDDGVWNIVRVYQVRYSETF